jgi:glycosyltransferase involved in cell wall biosynthesis
VSEVLVLAAAGPGVFNGIGDFSWELTRAMGATHPATLVVRGEAVAPEAAAPADARMATLRSWAELGDAAWMARGRAAEGVFVQFFPQAFVARDFPALLSWLRMRRSADRPVVVTLHEYWPHKSRSPRRELMRWRSRRAVRDLAAASTSVVVSQPYSAREVTLSGLVPASLLRVIPIGSAVPRVDPPAPPADPPVLASFGQPAMVDPRTVASLVEWTASAPERPRLWWFSRSEDELRQWWRRHLGDVPAAVTFFGGLPAREISARLRQATVGLALYADGASTRRSSLSALLEHELPIVGIDGRYTDDRMRQSGAMRLVPLEQPEALTSALATILRDSARRAEMAAAAARFFEATLSWPRIADAYLALDGAR